MSTLRRFDPDQHVTPDSSARPLDAASRWAAWTAFFAIASVGCFLVSVALVGVEASRDARDLVTMATVLFLAMCVLTTTAWGVTRTGLLAARGLRLKPPARPTGPIVPDSLTSWVKLFLALTAASFLALMGAISWEAGETFKSFLTTTFLVSAGASGFAALGWTLRKLGLVS